MTFVSYAQNFEDVLLWRALRDVKDGQYLDIGAQDPELDSVSLQFYRLGWRGIHVEPTVAYASRLRASRPDEVVIEAAVSDSAGPIEFCEVLETGLSTGRADIAKHHADAGYEQRSLLVACVRLDSLFDRFVGDINWMKVDVEGMEADVLRSWGDHPARPWILVIEATFPNSQRRTDGDWIEEVIKRGYRQAFFDGLSLYFVHESQSARCANFDAPANVFDGYAIERHHFSARPMRAEMEETERRLQTADAEVSELGAKLLDAEQRAAGTHKQLSDEQIRTATLQSQWEEAQEVIRSTRESEMAALRRLSDSESGHRASIDRLWAERDAAVQRLHEQQALAERDLRELVEEARSRENAANLELTRREQQAIHSAEAIQRAEADRDEAKAGANVLAGEIAQYRKEAEELNRSASEMESALRFADALIGNVRSQRPSRWLRLGSALGVWHQPPAQQALSVWTIGLCSRGSANIRSPLNEVQSMYSASGSEFRNPYFRANSLDELLGWNDIDFIRCAYVTMLGRQPDEEGECHYSLRLRAGSPKMEILSQLRRSREGRSHDPGIAGLDRALRRHQRAKWPVVGPLLGWEYRYEWTAFDRRMRQIESAIWQSHRHQGDLMRLLEQRLDNLSARSVVTEHPKLVQAAWSSADGPTASGAFASVAADCSEDLLTIFSRPAVHNVRTKLSAS